MGTPAWTIRMVIIFLLGSAEAFTESPRVMAHPMSRVRKVTDTRISVQPQFGARVKATAKVIERLDRIESKRLGARLDVQDGRSAGKPATLRFTNGHNAGDAGPAISLRHVMATRSQRRHHDLKRRRVARAGNHSDFAPAF